MIIEPKIRGFICTTAHPKGCFENVRQQINFVQSQKNYSRAKRVLVVGCSTGYGLASRIACAFAGGAATLGVMFERPASGNRTATAGWYNTAAFEEFASQKGLYAKTLNQDAFSAQTKQNVIQAIKDDLKTVDLVVYSLAAPRRTMADGSTVSSVLKTTSGNYTNKTIDLKTHQVTDISIPCATEQEIEDTVKVMGGDDWEQWIAALKQADVLAPNAVTLAYSYIGPEITHPIYAQGSIGRAKQHLLQTANNLSEHYGVAAYVSVNKALVTQSSAAIPIVPLYISLLYKVMKQKGVHEGCIEQMYRLFADKLTDTPIVDQQGQIRLDDLEMMPEVQQQVLEAWNQVNSSNVDSLADIDGYWEDFYHMFGFHMDGVDYQEDVDADIPIASVQM